MRIGNDVLASLLVLAALPSLAAAGQLASVPLSHAAGFQTVHCHIVNVGSSDLTVQKFWIDDVDFATTYANGASGYCTGLPPWTVPPGRGCSRELSVPSACDQSDACFCKVEFSGSPKNVRGNLVATVKGSTINLTSELR